ncbi:MAG TPA: aldo/keto reductase [Paraburkholderia sp.]|uniref:aldo/keto reductase n=1 Tax=Paraburkholderia sp. TaxID=1926495 RepID=UPI002ED474C1
MPSVQHERAALLKAIGPIAFGGASLGNLYRPMPDEQAEHTLATALESGIAYVDTAPFYGFGLSEKRIGRGLAKHDPDARIVLSSKVGRLLEPDTQADLTAVRSGFASPEPFRPVYDYGYDAVMRSWEESRRRLGRERIDILFAHDLGQRTHGADHPYHFRTFMDGGYRALRELRDGGEIAAIGLGVNEAEVCVEALAHGDFDVMLLASRYTLLEQAPLDTLLPICTERDVRLVIGGPYNSGILATGVTADSRYDYGAAPTSVVEKVAAIERLCAAYDIPLAAAALQFPLGHPQVAAVLPGFANEAQTLAAIRLVTTPIAADFWDELKSAGLLRADAPTPMSGSSKTNNANLLHTK